MSSPASSPADACRDRLLGELRSRTLSCEEILTASRELYGDADHLRLFGMPPRDFTRRGVRIRGRTAVECTLDPHAIAIAEAVDRVARELALVRWSLVDLFAGSGNFLYHLAERTTADPVLGFERDPETFRLSRDNLARTRSSARLYHGPYEKLLGAELVPGDRPAFLCLHPPWGDGFDFAAGLDLRRTDPPTPEILEAVYQRLPEHRIFIVHHIHERTVEASIGDVVRGQHVYARGVTAGSPPGKNSAYIVCGNQLLRRQERRNQQVEKL